MSTATTPRKGRSTGRLKPQHLEYVKLIQSGMPRYEAAIKAGFNEYTAQKAKTRIEHLPAVQKLMELAHINAQLEGQYGLHQAVKEVDKAITFAYDNRNPNAIAKLLEHKSKLFGLLIERIDVKTTYIDLKGALEDAKNRVLLHVNTLDRGISALNQSAPAPNSLPNGNIVTTDSLASACTDPSMDTPEPMQGLQCESKYQDTPTQAVKPEVKENNSLQGTSSDKVYYDNSPKLSGTT